MSEKTATVIGSTGMIGSLLTSELMSDHYYDYVRILVRKPVPITSNRLEIKLVDFNDPESVKLAIDGSDVVFSCIGGTMKNVRGNKNVYWKIDHDIPVNAARFAKETGCEKFVYVSSIGANAESNIFYTRMKGQTQKDVVATGIESVHVMEPGILLGKRKENRPLEKIFQFIMSPSGKLLPKSLKKYAAIGGLDVAKAMAAAAKIPDKGVFVYTYNDMMALIERSGKLAK